MLHHEFAHGTLTFRCMMHLQSGMHAWVDVGDGIALSVINSRRVIGFGGTFDLPVEKVSEKLSWCQVDPGSDEEVRASSTMHAW